jgi:NTE family protein
MLAQGCSTVTDLSVPARPAPYDKKVALVLQGGGALGSYQVGVYEALAASEYVPDWVAGISIGAVNAAIIAGSAPENRVRQLRSFWEEVTSRRQTWPLALAPLAEAERRSSSLVALMFGQPGFFAPRSMLDWISFPNLTSYYNTDSLKSTLERLVDFDRINAKTMRFSVGAVNVSTGSLTFFDNDTIAIHPEHVMASAALPPGFPAVEIDGEHYWDGGLISNTPLQYVLDYLPRRSRLSCQVDLFHAHGRVPTNLEEVNEREKDIRYSGRTRAGTEAMRVKHDVRHNINALHEMLPQELKDTPKAKWLYNFGCVTTMDVVQLIYRPDDPQGASKDYEFGRATMNARWAQGYSDARTTLFASPWLAPMPKEVGVRVFDVMHEILVKGARVAPAGAWADVGKTLAR